MDNPKDDTFDNCDPQLAINLTSMEIAQAVRHEAKNIIDTCQLHLAQLLIDKGAQVKDKEHIINDISDDLQSLSFALDKIKLVSRPRKRNLIQANLRKLWEESISIISGALSVNNISTSFVGKDTTIITVPDQMRHVFLNLLLNSIDSFKTRRHIKRRHISLNIVELCEQGECRVLYQDNAGGIKISDLNDPEKLLGKTESTNPNIVFRRGVTSMTSEKPGYGLYLVKQTIELCRGEIRLIECKNGVTFELKFITDFPPQLNP